MNKSNLKTVKLTDEEKAGLVSALINNDVSPAEVVKLDLTDRQRLTVIRRAVKDGFYSDEMPADAVIRGLRNMARARGISL